MSTKPRAKFDPGQQRWIRLCQASGCGNYTKDHLAFCGMCIHKYGLREIPVEAWNDLRVGLNLQKDPAPGASFVEFIPIESEVGRIIRIKMPQDGFGPEAVRQFWRRDQTRKSEADRIQEKVDRHVERALNDKTSIHDSILHEHNFGFGGTVTGRMSAPKVPYRDRLVCLEADLGKANKEIERLRGVEKELRDQLEKANSVRLTASFQVGQDVKFTSMSSLGWVNVYRNSNGRLQTGACPHPSQYSASNSRAVNPIGKYLGTFQIFAKDFES